MALSQVPDAKAYHGLQEEDIQLILWVWPWIKTLSKFNINPYLQPG